MHSDPSPRKDFTSLLRDWRSNRGLSQLELALKADISTRHLSFLETGRSEPSRRMVGRLNDALDVPFRNRNSLLLAAGFAPVYRQSSLDGDRLQRARRSLELLLRHHEPYPAFVLDRGWNIVMSNRGHDQIIDMLFSGRQRAKPDNALHLVLDPAQLRPQITNWTIVARTVLRRFESQLEYWGNDKEMLLLHDEVMAFPGVQEVLESRLDPIDDDILIPLDLQIGDFSTSWFTTLAGFGTPLDITLQELVIESLFPADEATESFVQGTAKAPPPDSDQL